MNADERFGLDVARRDELVTRVTNVLRSDSRVESVSLFGSLAGGRADEFSDVDVVAQLRPGVVDRDFFLDLPEVMANVGDGVAGWGFSSLPSSYLATFNFADYPLFWQVDVLCESDSHVDGSDLVSVYRWEQIYKMWIGAAKYAARAQKKLDETRELVARHASVRHVDDSTADELHALLDAIRERKIAKGDPYETLHARCEQLLEAFAQ